MPWSSLVLLAAVKAGTLLCAGFGTSRTPSLVFPAAVKAGTLWCAGFGTSRTPPPSCLPAAVKAGTLSSVRALVQAGCFSGLPLLQNFGAIAAASSINNAEPQSVSARTLLVMHVYHLWLPFRGHLEVPTLLLSILILTINIYLNINAIAFNNFRLSDDLDIETQYKYG